MWALIYLNIEYPESTEIFTFIHPWAQCSPW